MERRVSAAQAATAMTGESFWAALVVREVEEVAPSRRAIHSLSGSSGKQFPNLSRTFDIAMSDISLARRQMY
jgi:hypothetical protein